MTIRCMRLLALINLLSPNSLMPGGMQIHWVTGRGLPQDHAVWRYLRLPSRQNQQDWQAEVAL